jgi:hypothetical protein
VATRTTEWSLQISPATTWKTLFTVAAGQTNIVKSIFLFNNSGSTDGVYVEWLDAGGLRYPFFYNTSLSATSRLEWNGFSVGRPGDVLRAFSNLGTSTIRVSGSLLPGIA